MKKAFSNLTLDPQHLLALHVSAIDDAVITARGYRTITDGNELYRLGFSPEQSNLAPGLLLPIYDPSGGNGLYRFRPDKPRRKKNGESIKYEQPFGAGLRLDCNPLGRSQLLDPTRPIAFVEGEKKADALLSHGLCTISLPGVYGYKGRNQYGGVTLSADFDFISLKGRTAYVVFDSDAATNHNVSRAESILAEHLRRKGAAVRIIRLPGGPDGKKQGADDYLAAGHSLGELLALAVDNPKTLHSSYAHVKANGLPQIETNGRHHRDVVADALKALLASNNPPVYFVRSGLLVRLKLDECQRPTIEVVTESALRLRLAVVANFYMAQEKDGSTVYRPVTPLRDVVQSILAMGTWPMLPLAGILETPALRPNGTILDRPGYDSATGFFYCPAEGLAVPEIPANPTQAQIAEALALLLEIVCDYPFADDASEANALALILTPIYRPAISGPVPLALVNAPQPGTGKGLLADVTATMANGRPVQMTQLSKGEELRKTITSLLLGGETIICLDNISGMLYSPILASALTAREWKDRVLGKSETPGVPQRATWVATGNGIQLGGDLPRRCYAVNIDAKTSQPWTRENFRHPDLIQWVGANRGGLIAAALTLARGWYSAGCPKATIPVLGTFTAWADLVGGILAHAGMKGFLGNLQAMYAQADEEGAQWESFLAAMAEKFADASGQPKSVTVAELCGELAADSELREAIPDIGEELLTDSGDIRPKFKTKMGNALRHRAGRRHGKSQARAEKAGQTKSRAVKWHFIANGGGGNEATEAVYALRAREKEKTALGDERDIDRAGVGNAHSASAASVPPPCHACGFTDWRPHPDGNGEYCGVCHP